MSFTSVNEAAAQVKVTPVQQRQALVNELLRGQAATESQEGRDLLTRRAKLMTKLREEKLWP